MNLNQLDIFNFILFSRVQTRSCHFKSFQILYHDFPPFCTRIHILPPLELPSSESSKPLPWQHHCYFSQGKQHLYWSWSFCPLTSIADHKAHEKVSSLSVNSDLKYSVVIPKVQTYIEYNEKEAKRQDEVSWSVNCKQKYLNPMHKNLLHVYRLQFYLIEHLLGWEYKKISFSRHVQNVLT